MISHEVRVNYTNYRGETSCRTITPVRLYFGSNEWHKEPQWLLDVIDQDKKELRTFSMKGIEKWWIPFNEEQS